MFYKAILSILAAILTFKFACENFADEESFMTGKF